MIISRNSSLRHRLTAVMLRTPASFTIAKAGYFASHQSQLLQKIFHLRFHDLSEEIAHQKETQHASHPAKENPPTTVQNTA